MAHAIKGEQNTKGTAQFNAIAWLQAAFLPRKNIIIPQYTPNQPQQPVSMAYVDPPRVEAQAPRVAFDVVVPWPVINDTNPVDTAVHKKVECREPNPSSENKIPATPLIVVSKPHSPLNGIENSVTARVKAHCIAAARTPPVELQSIAEQFRARRHVPANTTTHQQIHMFVDMETGKLLEYHKLLHHPKFKDAWSTLAANEFGRLVQGVGGRVQGTNTIYFIHKAEIPIDPWKDITYIKFVCTVRTKTKEPNWTKATLGGNLINYAAVVGTPTANLPLIKIFLNSMISMPGAQFATADISNFYLMTSFLQPEFARVELSNILEEIINE